MTEKSVKEQVREIVESLEKTPNAILDPDLEIDLTEQLVRKEFMDNFRTVFKEQFDAVERVTEERVRKECEEEFKKKVEIITKGFDEVTTDFRNQAVVDQTKKIFEEIEKNKLLITTTITKLLNAQKNIEKLTIRDFDWFISDLEIYLSNWENLKKKELKQK
jgi:DNA-directed RNA polymerase beta subunit